MKDKNNRKMLNLPAWLFVSVMVVVYELFLHFGTMDSFVAARFGVILVFAIGFASALSFLISLFPARAQKWISLILVLVLAILYIVQYFIHDAYQVFMNFAGILAGTGNVATNYLDVVLGLLGRNLWKIALLLLPIFLFGRFVKVPSVKMIQRFCLLGLAVSMYLMGFGLVYKFDLDAEKFTVSTSFDNAVTSFGLNMGLGMDLLGSTTEEDLDFETELYIPQKATEAPTEAPTQPPVESGETEPAEALPEETQAPTEPPRELQPHSLNLDFATMAENEKRDDIAKVHRYMASQTPAMENEYTGLFEGKNLIFITAEAFSKQAVDPERTPTLYRMMTEGIYFTDYYQPTWGAGTTGGEYSNLLSLVPYGSTTSMQEVVQQDIFHSIGKQLQARGYSSAAFHNNDYKYYNRHQTHPYLGYDVFIGEGNGMEQGVTHTWPQSDEEMFRYTIPQYIDQQPFSLYYMTVSGHATYLFQNNAMSRKNQEYVADLDSSQPVQAYLACQMELEHSMAYLLEELEAKGIMDDTVVVIATDHYPYGLAPSDTWGTNQDYLSELMGEPVGDSFTREQSALIIWSGCLEDMDLQVDAPTMSLDILPTISNLFGVSYDSRLMCGRDVFSDQMPLAFWIDGFWKTDLGSYNGYTGQFTLAEGVEIEDVDAYIKSIRSVIKNKLTYAQAVAYYNYFDYINAELERMNAPAETAPPETTP